MYKRKPHNLGYLHATNPQWSQVRSMVHLLGQLVRTRFPAPHWLLWFCCFRAALVLCALCPEDHWGVPSHWCRLGGWGTLGPLFSRFAFFFFSGNTIPLIIRKLSVNLHSVIPRAINQTRDLTGSYNSWMESLVMVLGKEGGLSLSNRPWCSAHPRSPQFCGL